MILSFWTDRSGQSVQTKIRLLLVYLNCLQFHLHLLEALLYVKPRCLNFRVITANFSDAQIFKIFTVPYVLSYVLQCCLVQTIFLDCHTTVL